MIDGMTTEERAEYLTVLRRAQFEDDFAAMRRGRSSIPGASLDALCRNLPKLPTLDEYAAAQRDDFQNIGRAVRYACLASVVCVALIGFAWWLAR